MTLGFTALVTAIVGEVAGTMSLRKATTGSKAWFVAVVGGYVFAFSMLSVSLAQGLPLGLAYGIWAAAGVALTAILSKVLFEEPLTPVMGAGIALKSYLSKWDLRTELSSFKLFNLPLLYKVLMARISPGHQRHLVVQVRLLLVCLCFFLVTQVFLVPVEVVEVVVNNRVAGVTHDVVGRATRGCVYFQSH